MLDTIISGSILFGFGYVALMFAGFFVRTVAPAPKQVGLSEVAGEDLLQQSMTIPPVMEYVDIFADDDLIDEEPWEYGEDPSLAEELPAFPGDVEMTAEPDAVDLAEPLPRCMAKAMAPEARLTVTVDEHPALEGLSIRELKALASEAKIKRYSNLTKEELIKRLRKAA